MKIPKIIFFISIAAYFIPIVSAGASSISGSIVINGSGNNLTSIGIDIGNSSIFFYNTSTRTAIVNANIFVNENSELIIDNQTLIFNCSSPGQYRLETNSNGTHEMGGNSTLIIMNRSHLTASNPDKEFYMVIRNNSAFTMKDSTLTECGFNSNHPGLNIKASYANVTDNVIYDVYTGIYLYHAEGCNISGNDISSGKEGIYLYQADYCSILGNNISSENKSVYIHYSDNCTVLGNAIYAKAEEGVRLMKANYSKVYGNNISSNSSNGIYVYESYYCDILGNYNISSTWKNGIAIYNSYNLSISENNISSEKSNGVYIENSYYCDILGNDIDTDLSSGGKGIWLGNSSYCNISGNDILSKLQGMYLDSSSNNAISNSQIRSLDSNYYAVHLLSSSNNVNIISSVIMGNTKDIRLDNSQNLRLINTSYNDVNIADSTSYLHRHWYLDVYVNDSAGDPIEGANVTSWTEDGTQAFTTLTGTTGSISRQTLEQYNETKDNKTYFTPHTIEASKGNYLSQTMTVNLTENEFEVFTLNTPLNVTLISIDGKGNDSVTNNKTPLVEFRFVDPEQSIASCRICINSSCNSGENSSTMNNTPTNITISTTLPEGKWSVYVECDDEFDIGESENWTFYVNTLPEVELISPENFNTTGEINLGGIIDFWYIVSDTNPLLNCTFYNNFTGNWEENGSQSTCSGSLDNFTRNLTEGVYIWNVKCDDGLQSAFAPSNYTIKVDSNAPDLSTSSTDISFSISDPEPGDVVVITVRVRNNGIDNVTNVTVEFQHNWVSQASNSLSVTGNSINYTKFSWTANSGLNYLTFIVDPDNHITEFDESNNEVSISENIETTYTIPPKGGGGGGTPPYVAKPKPSCFDGIKNCHDGDCEEEIDCGGPCDPCMTCSDGIQNQGEEGIDCGGPCPPCTTTETTTTSLPATTTPQSDSTGSGVETGSGASSGSGGSSMVNLARPVGNTTSTTTISMSTTTTILAPGEMNFVDVAQKQLFGAQKQLFGFISGVYAVVSDNPVESTVSVLLLLGLLYIYYSRVRSSDLEKET